MANTQPTSSIYPSFLFLEKFINLLMIAGKKSVAYNIFSAACHDFVLAAEKSTTTPPSKSEGKRKQPVKSRKVRTRTADENRLLLLLQTAIENVQPSLEGRKCRVGGTTKIIPAIVSKNRGLHLAMRWIIESAKKRKKAGKTNFSQCLTEELLDAYQKCGRPRQRRDEYHKMCQVSRGYLRYRWW